MLLFQIRGRLPPAKRDHTEVKDPIGYLLGIFSLPQEYRDIVAHLKDALEFHDLTDVLVHVRSVEHYIQEATSVINSFLSSSMLTERRQEMRRLFIGMLEEIYLKSTEDPSHIPTTKFADAVYYLTLVFSDRLQWGKKDDIFLMHNLKDPSGYDKFLFFDERLVSNDEFRSGEEHDFKSFDDIISALVLKRTMIKIMYRFAEESGKEWNSFDKTQHHNHLGSIDAAIDKLGKMGDLYENESVGSQELASKVAGQIVRLGLENFNAFYRNLHEDSPEYAELDDPAQLIVLNLLTKTYKKLEEEQIGGMNFFVEPTRLLESMEKTVPVALYALFKEGYDLGEIEERLVEKSRQMAEVFYELGIRYHERYSPELLYETYRVIAEKGYYKPGDRLSIITMSESDWNNAFLNDKEALDSLLEHGHVIVCECRRDNEWFDRVRNFGLESEGRNGESLNRPSENLCVIPKDVKPTYTNMIVLGHGSPTTIALGKVLRGRGELLDTEDEARFEEGVLRDYFNGPKSTCAVISCLTDSDLPEPRKNIKEMIEDLTGAKVIAPKLEASTWSLSFDKNTGQITSVTYYYPSTGETVPIGNN